METTQVELAGRTEGPSFRPDRGQLLRDFTLPSTSGKQVSISQYHGKQNLVLLFATRKDDLLRRLEASYPAFREEQTEVLAIVKGSIEAGASSVPFPVLMDRGGAAHQLARADGQHRALYIADRFGEVFGAFRESDGATIPAVEEIVEQVRFINIQCDECAHPEWPVV